MQTIVV